MGAVAVVVLPPLVVVAAFSTDSYLCEPRGCRRRFASCLMVSCVCVLCVRVRAVVRLLCTGVQAEEAASGPASVTRRYQLLPSSTSLCLPAAATLFASRPLVTSAFLALFF